MPRRQGRFDSGSPLHGWLGFGRIASCRIAKSRNSLGSQPKLFAGFKHLEGGHGNYSRSAKAEGEWSLPSLPEPIQSGGGKKNFRKAPANVSGSTGCHLNVAGLHT